MMFSISWLMSCNSSASHSLMISEWAAFIVKDEGWVPKQCKGDWRDVWNTILAEWVLCISISRFHTKVTQQSAIYTLRGAQRHINLTHFPPITTSSRCHVPRYVPVIKETLPWQCNSFLIGLRIFAKPATGEHFNYAQTQLVSMTL